MFNLLKVSVVLAVLGFGSVSFAKGEFAPATVYTPPVVFSSIGEMKDSKKVAFPSMLTDMLMPKLVELMVTTGKVVKLESLSVRHIQRFSTKACYSGYDAVARVSIGAEKSEQEIEFGFGSEPAFRDQGMGFCKVRRDQLMGI